MKPEGRASFATLATAGGAGLLVAREYGGLGATAAQAADALRAIGSRSGSLAVGTTMHHYKIAWLAESLEPALRAPVLERVAREGLLVASCGAEGKQTRGTFNPGIEVQEHDGGVVVNGVKRPCSLVWDMGVLSMLVRLPDGHHSAGEMAILLIDADHPQLRRRVLWRNDAMAASQTDEIGLEYVFVPPNGIIPLGADTGDEGASAILTWFEVLITAAYLGVASGLVEAAASASGDGIDAVLEAVGTAARLGDVDEGTSIINVTYSCSSPAVP